MKRAVNETTLLDALGRRQKLAHVQRAPAEMRTVDGIRFASKAERIRYEELKVLQRVGEVLRFHRQPIFDVLGVVVRADFQVFWKNGLVTYEDVKGSGGWRDADQRFRRNHRQVREAYGVQIQVVER